ncbi:MAG: sugar kinase [Arenicellales bacterium]|nr:sugar kinase [Arenicellales bacterium]
MIARTQRFAAIGECMIELSDRQRGGFDLAFGGDSANTAVYIARLLRHMPVSVDYVSALGDDPYSDQILSFLEGEGIGTHLVCRFDGRLPGLYIIRTDSRGERRFYYYRDQAAVRELFSAGGDKIQTALEEYDWLYLTGITLSVLQADEQIEKLIEALARARAKGGRVAFDSNYRPVGWASAESARTVFRDILGYVDVALVTLDDEQALFGDGDDASCAGRLHAMGVAEVVVKLGASGCFVSAERVQRHISGIPNPSPVDTTAAGDAFNAAYLASRLSGGDPNAAAQRGNELAAEVIRHHGAVIATDDMPAAPELPG